MSRRGVCFSSSPRSPSWAYNLQQPQPEQQEQPGYQQEQPGYQQEQQRRQGELCCWFSKRALQGVLRPSKPPSCALSPKCPWRCREVPCLDYEPTLVGKTTRMAKNPRNSNSNSNSLDAESPSGAACPCSDPPCLHIASAPLAQGMKLSCWSTLYSRVLNYRWRITKVCSNSYSYS